jgi:hypothetical protein
MIITEKQDYIIFEKAVDEPDFLEFSDKTIKVHASMASDVYCGGTIELDEPHTKMLYKTMKSVFEPPVAASVPKESDGNIQILMHDQFRPMYEKLKELGYKKFTDIIDLFPEYLKHDRHKQKIARVYYNSYENTIDLDTLKIVKSLCVRGCKLENFSIYSRLLNDEKQESFLMYNIWNPIKVNDISDTIFIIKQL